MTTTYLYCIENHDGAFKIGISANPKKRLQKLQTGNPNPLKLTDEAEIPSHISPRLLESFLHYYLRDFQISNEWFFADGPQIEEALDKAIAKVLAKENLPNDMALLRVQVSPETKHDFMVYATKNRIPADRLFQKIWEIAKPLLTS